MSDRMNDTNTLQEIAETEDLSLEEMFAQLDEILAAMDDREISLEDAFSLYEKGMKQIRRCSEKLDLVEKKMLVIAQDGAEEPFK
ncbi:MAG: exodeoxyribonuclease VII small subunit [Clostridiales bacterium]|nr:exodeoxyribonuclease VII small subunit [Clostridiales bacterium]